MSFLERLEHLPETPLRNLRFSLWWVRKTFFTRDRSVVPMFRVALTVEEAEVLLGEVHFEPGWETSYHYRDEVLNLRRAKYVDQGGYVWWQLHVRGYDDGAGGLLLAPHFELEPTEHPDGHVRQVGIDVEDGLQRFARVLDDLAISYERVDPPGWDETAAARAATTPAAQARRRIES